MQRWQGGTNNKEVDKLLAMGYLQVNTGKLVEGIELFNSILAQYGEVVAAYLGRGTALALGGRLDDATRDFSQAIAIDPTVADAYKRRAQVRACVSPVGGWGWEAVTGVPSVWI